MVCRLDRRDEVTGSVISFVPMTSLLCSEKHCAGSQKATNLARDDRISLTIGHDTEDARAIAGLSMAAHGQPGVERVDADEALRMLVRKYLEPVSFRVPTLTPENVRIFRVTPMVISVLDYSKGFGHTDLAFC